MVLVKRLVLDVLKPHRPNVLEFSQALARAGGDYHVCTTVLEIDEKTETLKVVVEGKTIDFEALEAKIGELGGSLHSIDEVEVQSVPQTG